MPYEEFKTMLGAMIRDTKDRDLIPQREVQDGLLDLWSALNRDIAGDEVLIEEPVLEPA